MSFKTTTALTALFCLASAHAFAADGTITAGAGTITHPTPSQTLVTQTTDRAVISWPAGINTTPAESLQFAQPNSNAIALNIVGGGRTNFEGSLTANGKVWIVNPDGMLFNGATVNVGSLLLSTAGISDPEGDGFYTNNTGKYMFDKPGNPTAIIINDSTIRANGNNTTNGDIVVLSQALAIQNGSHVSTDTGKVMLQAGETFVVDFDGDGLVNYQANRSIVNYVSQIVPGVDESIYIGSGSTIQTKPISDPSVPTPMQIFIGANIYQEAVLDHVINLGGTYYDSPTHSSSGVLEPVSINPGYIWAVAPIVPAPPIIPVTPTPAPTAVNNNIVILPLSRPLASLGDETVKDTTVNPTIDNVAYARPYLVSLADSIAEGRLNLSMPDNGAGAPSPTYLGNLSPAAGGNMDAARLANLSPAAGGDMTAPENLANLSPSAGNETATLASAAGCANNYLDAGWLGDPTMRRCSNEY